MRQRLVILTTLLACIAAAWWMLGSTEPPTLAPGQVPVDAGVTGVPAHAAPASTAAAAATAETVHGERRQVTTEEDVGPTMDLRVVLHGSDAPVAGAVVHYVPPDFDWKRLPADERGGLERLRFTNPEACLHRIGRTRITDAEGWCRIPLGAEGAQTCARAGELYGEHWATADTATPQVLTMRTDVTLRVRVVDAGGAPAAGVPLELERDTQAQTPSPPIGPTDADGRWVWPHVQVRFGEPPPDSLGIAAAPPGMRASARFDLLDPPAEVLLRLPEGGSVTVHVRDADGNPIDPVFLDEAEVTLTAYERKPDAQDVRTARSRGRTMPLGENGDAVFPRVGFHRHLLVGALHLRTERSVEGPTPTRPHVEITLQDTATSSIFVGTLRNEDGTPYARREFWLECRSASSLNGCAGRTDEYGRLRCTFDDRMNGMSCAMTVGTQPDADVQVAANLPPRLVQAGINDLGEVRLLPHHVLVAGRLVREPGVEVKTVSFTVQHRMSASSDRYWNQLWNLRPEWGDDGQFKVRGSLPVGEVLQLVVIKGPFLPVAPIQCRAGDTDIEITLRAAGSAHAEFLVDAGVPLDQLRFHFQRMDEPDGSGGQRRQDNWGGYGIRADAEGRLRRTWTGLAAGRYQLSVVSSNAVEPIASVDGIEVTTGPCPDPRLQAIDLRSRIRTIEIRATDGLGAPIRDRRALVIARRPVEGQEHWRAYDLGNGVVALAASTPLDLWVLAPDCEMAVADAVAESRSIALRPAAKSRVRLELPAPLPDDVSLRLQLRPKLELPGLLQIDSSRMPIESFLAEDVEVPVDGTVEVSVRWPGEYTVFAKLVRGPRTNLVSDVTPRRITLPELTTVTVHVGLTGLEKALEPRVR